MAVKEEKTGTFFNMLVTLERQTDTIPPSLLLAPDSRPRYFTKHRVALSEPSGILENVPVFSSFTAI